MNQKIAELNEKRVELADQIKALSDVEEWTAEHEARWDALNEEYNTTTESIDELIRSDEARKSRLAQMAKIDESLSQQSRTQLMQNSPIVLAGGDGETVLRQREQRADLAMKAWIRHNNRREVTPRQKQACAELQFEYRDEVFSTDLLNIHLERGLEGFQSGGGLCWDQFESRVMDIVTPNIGTETIPTGFVRELERAMLAFGGVRRVARIFRTNEATNYDWPTANDTAQAAAILAEGAAIVHTDIPTDKITFGAYKFQSGVQLTQELLEDNAVGLGGMIGSFLGERLGRGTAAYFATGTGTAQPEGIVNAPEGKVAAASNAITSDEVIDLIHSVDPAYRGMPSVGFIMHDSTVAAIRKLKTSDGAYHWQPGMQAGVPDRLFGFRYVVDNNMPQISDGVSSKIIVFGAMEKFVIRDHAQTRFYRLDELYRGNDLTGFTIFSRHDSRLLDAGTNPLKHLALAAS